MWGCTGILGGVGLFITAAMCGCGAGHVIYAEDVVITAGQSSRFSAFVQSRLHHGDVIGVPVSFASNGKLIGRARTDSDGRASIVLPIQNEMGAYQAHTVVDGHRYQATGNVYRWDPTRTILAIDLDETISRTSYSDLFFTEMVDRSPVVKDSPAVLRQLSKDYQLLYMSARPRWLHTKTKRWLDDEGFPKGPILHANGFEACFRQEYYKRLMLAGFKSEHPNLLVGIGDKGVDERAYGDNDMLAIILGSNPKRYASHCIVLPDWRAVGGFLNQHRNTLTRSDAVAQVFREHNRDLRGYFEASTATALARADDNSRPLKHYRAPARISTARNIASSTVRPIVR